MKFTTELINKLKHYCFVAARQYKRGQSHMVRFYAEEGLSTLLERWAKKEPKDNNDDYYFICCKNSVYSQIMKYENTKKRAMFNEKNSLRLDAGFGNIDDLEIVGPSYDMEYYEDIRTENEEIEYKLNLIVNTVQNDPNIDEKDLDIFISKYIKGISLAKYSREMDISYNKVLSRHRKIKNILNYLYNKYNEKDNG